MGPRNSNRRPTRRASGGYLNDHKRWQVVSEAHVAAADEHLRDHNLFVTRAEAVRAAERRAELNPGVTFLVLDRAATEGATA